MNARRLSLLAAFHAATAAVHLFGATTTAQPLRLGPAEFEENIWPVLVRQSQPVERRLDTLAAAGPFYFEKPAATADGDTASGLRPFWVQFNHPDGQLKSAHVLYPLFSYSRDENTYKWSLLELVRGWDRRSSAGAPSSVFDQRGEFEIFPLWFSRQSGDPELSYRALFPIHGTIKNKLFFEKLSWTLFPLYARNEKRGAVTTFAPWPIVRIHSGATRGWGVWPLYNHRERPGVFDETYVLWPFGYNVTRQPAPDAPAGTPPRRDFGALPFYAKSTGPGFVNEDYLWPFFGYTDSRKTEPIGGGLLGFTKPDAPTREVVYHERRYFWPFLVQGRGTDRTVSRYAPFYTHSVSKGVEKEWFLWPLVRRAGWTDEGVERHRTQFLYFVYWNEEQRAAGRTNSPAAELTHVWPLVSHWDNGAGQRQWQFPSPLEVFFPHNDKMRHTWSPFFSLARHDQRAPGVSRTSLLWNAITYEKHEPAQRSEFHLGPLFSHARENDARRITLGNGLLGVERSPAGRWKMFWLDFPSKTASPTPATR